MLPQFPASLAFVLCLLVGTASAQDSLGLSDAGMWPGENANPVEPNAKASLLALQTLTRSPTLDPRHAPMDPQAGRPRNSWTVDHDLELFTRTSYYVMNGGDIDGSSNTFHVAWSRPLPDSARSWGVRGFVQRIATTVPQYASPGGVGNILFYVDQSFLNFSLGTFGEKTIVRKPDQLASVGLSLDLLLFDAAFSEPALLNSRIGGLVSAYARISQWLNGHRLSAGALLAQGLAGHLIQTNLGFAGEWVAPLHPKLDFKASASWKVLLFQRMSNLTSQSDVATSTNLFLTAGLVYWIKPAIGIDLAYRSTMLVPDLNNQTVLLGASFGF